jgi:hypothetical protein
MPGAKSSIREPAISFMHIYPILPRRNLIWAEYLCYRQQKIHCMSGEFKSTFNRNDPPTLLLHVDQHHPETRRMAPRSSMPSGCDGTGKREDPNVGHKAAPHGGHGMPVNQVEQVNPSNFSRWDTYSRGGREIRIRRSDMVPF